MLSGQSFSLVAGLDFGDKTSHLCFLDALTGAVVETSSIRTGVESFRRYLKVGTLMRVALETGTHSPWASRAIGLLESWEMRSSP